jgi:hypothetical protein
MKPSRETLINKGVNKELIDSAEQYFTEDIKYCVIEIYPTEDTPQVLLQRILTPGDDDILEYTNILTRFFSRSKFIKIQA